QRNLYPGVQVRHMIRAQFVRAVDTVNAATASGTACVCHAASRRFWLAATFALLAQRGPQYLPLLATGAHVSPHFAHVFDFRLRRIGTVSDGTARRDMCVSSDVTRPDAMRRFSARTSMARSSRFVQYQPRYGCAG